MRPLLASLLLPSSLLLVSAFLASAEPLPNGGVIEHEADLAKPEEHIHNGLGKTTGYVFFQQTPDLSYSFRKRVLTPGATIGYHQKDEYESFYILSGTGLMTVDGKEFPVRAGDGILCGKGSAHGIKQTGSENLVFIITFEKPAKKINPLPDEPRQLNRDDHIENSTPRQGR